MDARENREKKTQKRLKKPRDSRRVVKEVGHRGQTSQLIVRGALPAVTCRNVLDKITQPRES